MQKQLTAKEEFELLVGPGANGYFATIENLTDDPDYRYGAGLIQRIEKATSPIIGEYFVTWLRLTSGIFEDAFLKFKMKGFYLPYANFNSIRAQYFDWIFPALVKGIKDGKDFNFWDKAWDELRIHDENKKDDLQNQIKLAFRHIWLSTKRFTPDVVNLITLDSRQEHRTNSFLKTIYILSHLTDSFETPPAMLIRYITALECLADASLQNELDSEGISFSMKWKNTNKEFPDFLYYTDMFQTIKGIKTIIYRAPTAEEQKTIAMERRLIQVKREQTQETARQIVGGSQFTRALEEETDLGKTEKTLSHEFAEMTLSSASRKGQSCSMDTTQ